jgi:hypothetical protein
VADPIHTCALVGMGIHLLDNLRLDLLADACAERSRSEILFVVAQFADRVARARPSTRSPSARAKRPSVVGGL